MGLLQWRGVARWFAWCASTLQEAPHTTRLRTTTHTHKHHTQIYVDASSSSFECLARYINDCGHPQGHNVTVRKLPEEGKAVLVAARDVAAGEELFFSYGPWYWLASRLSPSSSMRRVSDAELEAMWRSMGIEKSVVR